MVKLVSSDIDDNNDVVDNAIDDEEDDDKDDGETCACDIEHCGDDASVELGEGAGHVVSSGI